jgi:thioredoxin 1
MLNEPIHVTDAAFEKTVIQSVLPVVVDFWATWCGPCKAIAPVLEKLAQEYTGKVIVAKVNVDENPDTASKYGVQSIPTLLFFANGKVIHQHIGNAPESILRNIFLQFLEVSQPNKENKAS